MPNPTLKRDCAKARSPLAPLHGLPPLSSNCNLFQSGVRLQLYIRPVGESL
jgi:hypothetical protein